jgi:hypothetical protein
MERVRQLFLVVLFSAALVPQACLNGNVAQPAPTAQTSDLLGTWQADYSRYGFLNDCYPRRCPGAMEILILEKGGGYDQTYYDGQGRVYESPGHGWYLVDNQLYLRDGRYYPLGLQDADDFAEGELSGNIFFEQGEWSSEFRATTPTVVILDVRPSSIAPGGWVLKYPGMGIDPDFPEFVSFERVITSTRGPTTAP